MVVAAEHITPRHVAAMRRDAGGLLCLAIASEVTAKLGLAFMHDMIADMGKVNPIFTKLTDGKAAYGDRPSFSIAINHRSTYTGITDSDRATTISKMANEVCKKIDTGGVDYFAANFRAPGHVPILIAAKGLLAERKGHTELCVYLAKLAGITPAVAICEMMDSATYRALSVDKAAEYARQAGGDNSAQIPLVEGSELRQDYHDRQRKARVA
jgi:3,4-dihydroxy 2-butanone 4-phosphate synthase